MKTRVFADYEIQSPQIIWFGLNRVWCGGRWNNVDFLHS